MNPKKSLGQHWLTDEVILNQIADAADLTPDDTVLEIGPGLGTLTRVLSDRAGKVIAVEFDSDLAKTLLNSFLPFEPSVSVGNFPKLSSDNFTENPQGIRVPKNEFNKVDIINEDFLSFDLEQLPIGYKVVANIPYYITGKIIEKLLTAQNKPSVAVLLVQKEVAERVAAKPGGDMSLLSVVAQYYADVKLGAIVPAAKFTPPPKVDSQVLTLLPLDSPFKVADEKQLFRIVKAGFSQRRKKLRTAIAGGLNISVTESEKLLKSANIDPNLRAQDLTVEQWCDILKNR